jgi:integrase
MWEMSFVDMANLRISNVKNGYIIYARSKTKQALTVKIEDCMQEIIMRYEHTTIDDYLLPVYTTQNRDHTSQLRNHNKRLKRISDMLGLENPLSSYVSRHTWATMALRKGIPVKSSAKAWNTKTRPRHVSILLRWNNPL